MKRPIKTYQVDGDLIEWIQENRLRIHIDILEVCEDNIESENLDEIAAINVKTQNTMNLFVLNDEEAIIETLGLAISSFVECEEYELAARARDCKLSWEKRLSENGNVSS